jgi:hypothetical protein
MKRFTLYEILLCTLVPGSQRFPDPKELREGMNRQHIYREDQKADDHSGKFFIFASGL